MSFLSMNNIFMKAHNNRFLQEATQPPRPPISSPPSQSTRNLLLTADNTKITTTTTQITENNNQITTNENDKTIQEVWSRYNFDTISNINKSTTNIGNYIVENNVKMSWAAENQHSTTTTNIDEDDDDGGGDNNNKMDHDIEEDNNKEEGGGATSPTNFEEREEPSSPSHHARRPPNAFLIFCKKHRPIVRNKFPNLENRGVTKILGEWWALLDVGEKAPFTQLAKEYKDAFFSANPDFKWYKLPAPPLRTLTVRPSNISKAPSPVSSPVHVFPSSESEFTPGKLADESQLGSLTSLLNSNYNTSGKLTEELKVEERTSENNNNNIEDNSLNSPVNLIKTSLPPAPIKKRIFQKYLDNNNIVARNLLESDISKSGSGDGGLLYNQEQHSHDTMNGTDNMTNQDLLNKVVDKIFTRDEYGLRSSKETRKSGRQCKGKRYEQFMVEGRLLGNKRDTKLTSQRYCDDKFENELNLKFEIKSETETPNLDHTIKRLAERTNMKILLNENDSEQMNKNENDRVRSTVTTAESNSSSTDNASKLTNNFNLDLKIQNLPTLNYDAFVQRKKESKKRKNRIRTDSEPKSKIAKIMKNEQPVGSKKRKNKHSITHLEKKEDNTINNDNDLLGLATLAEVAANTQKINEGMKITE